jgi:Nucleolar GTP-binding protein 1 (NOG1)
MNTIEMQSVTALAHLRSCVLYFMDLSGECGYSVAQQVQLFQNIRPLFANKVTFLAINKIDRVKLSDLDTETQALVQGLLADGTVEVLELSCATEEGVMLARNRACEKLLAARVEQKLKGGRINDVLNKIHLATPMARDDVPRLPFIPDVVKDRGLYDWNDPDRRRLEKDLEVEAGGAGAYSVDLKSPLPFRQFLLMIQRIICWTIRIGSMMFSLKLWMERTSMTCITCHSIELMVALIQKSKKNSMPWRKRKNASKQEASTIPTKTL